MTTINNSAEFNAGEFGTLETNIVQADILTLVVTKKQNGSDKPISVVSGSEITYDVTINNPLEQAIPSVVFTDSIGSLVSFVKGSFTVNGKEDTPTLTNDTLSYTIESLEPQATTTISFKVAVL